MPRERMTYPHQPWPLFAIARTSPRKAVMAVIGWRENGRPLVLPLGNIAAQPTLFAWDSDTEAVWGPLNFYSTYESAAAARVRRLADGGGSGSPAGQVVAEAVAITRSADDAR